MQVVLKQGEKLSVTLADSDGEFVIEYGQNELTVTSDLPDTAGRSGEIYREEFGSCYDPDEVRNG